MFKFSNGVGLGLATVLVMNKLGISYQELVFEYVAETQHNYVMHDWSFNRWVWATFNLYFDFTF